MMLIPCFSGGLLSSLHLACHGDTFIWRALNGISFLGPIHTYRFRVRLDVFHVIWPGRTLGPSLQWTNVSLSSLISILSPTASARLVHL